MDNGINRSAPLALFEYRRDRAVEYAKRWALSRNPLFVDFAGVGGDCTNFVSQAILSGCCKMNDTPTFGWYYLSPDDRAPAWSGVDEFFNFMTGNGDFPPLLSRVGPIGYVTDRDYAAFGDVVQLSNRDGEFYHTLIITGNDGRGDILVSAHTNDALDRPLSSYPSVSERFIHIIGCLAPIDSPPSDCFMGLLNGTKATQE